MEEFVFDGIDCILQPGKCVGGLFVCEAAGLI
jgi:hypothetical protein